MVFILDKIIQMIIDQSQMRNELDNKLI